jgi:hypothetical protein
MDILYFPTSAKGYRYGLVISDLYSLYISFYPLKTKGSAEVAKNLNAYFAAHGPPLYIYSDNDPSFRGETEKVLRLLNVKHYTSYPFTQRQNYVESQIRIFKNAYRAAIIDSPVFRTKDWDFLYPLVVCRINSMISKYGMSREAVHYGHVLESNLPIITDAAIYEPLEADLEKAANLFHDRMGRFMQKKNRNKEYYRLGKKFNFYINELVMYKVYTPASMLHPTYAGPARIVDLHERGATLRDTKFGTIFSVVFDNLRKINFEELLTLLPQNFDAEIADTLKNYRYRRTAPDQDTDSMQVEPDTDPPDPDSLDGEFETGLSEPAPVEPLVRGQVSDEPVPGAKRTRSGRLYTVKVDHLPKKYADEVKSCVIRPGCIPRIRPPSDALPSVPCLRRRPPVKKLDRIAGVNGRINTKPAPLVQFMHLEALKRISAYVENAWKKATFSSNSRCTQKMVLHGNKPPGRVKFGEITVFHI